MATAGRIVFPEFREAPRIGNLPGNLGSPSLRHCCQIWQHGRRSPAIDIPDARPSACYQHCRRGPSVYLTVVRSASVVPSVLQHNTVRKMRAPGKMPSQGSDVIVVCA